jgi:Tfp pilus assembly protein PilF
MSALAVAALAELEQERLPQAHRFAQAAGQVMLAAGLAGSPHGALPWTALAAVHGTQGKTGQARAEFERALRSRQLSLDANPWLTAAILLWFAALLIDAGDPGAARASYARATAVTAALPGGAEAMGPRFDRLERRLAGLPSGIFRGC